MKKYIFSGKQVGTVYYLVDSLESLYMILRQGQIKVSSKKEKSPGSDITEYFVSLTRNYKSLSRQNPDRWHCGLILDGTALSDQYSISPIHYSGYAVEQTQMEDRSGGLKIKQITHWEDNTFDILLAGWKSTLSISAYCYDDIAKCIDELDESVKTRCRLKIAEGKAKSPKKGCKFVERYIFNNPAGGPPGLVKMLTPRSQREIFNITDQFEERVHGPRNTKNMSNKFKSLKEGVDTKYPYIHIDNAIKGIILNNSDFDTGNAKLDEHNEEMVKRCEDILKSKYGLTSYMTEEIE